MKCFLALSALIISSAAFAEEETISKNVIREFQCEGSYTLPASKKTPDQKPLGFTAKMIDYSLTTEADPSYLAHIGGMEITGDFVPQIAKVSWTEATTEDVEATRDDDPEGRNGWGGKAFYTSVIKGDAENPDEIFVFVTMAARPQQGLAVRDYEIGAIKMIKPVEPGEEYLQEVLAQGKMLCKQL